MGLLVDDSILVLRVGGEDVELRELFFFEFLEHHLLFDVSLFIRLFILRLTRYVNALGMLVIQRTTHGTLKAIQPSKD